jgi:hypothetical protein
LVFVPIIAVLVTIIVGLTITRIATVMLVFTGLSRELARFQARSAYTTVGYATAESERLMDHPVRRRIIMALMLMGNAGIAATVASMAGIFLQTGQGSVAVELLVLAGGLVAIWLFARSKWLDDKLFRYISWLLQRFTPLEIYDYQGLLHLSDGYSVVEQRVEADDWVAGKNLAAMRLSEEGIQVLGIHRANGHYVATPLGTSVIRSGDTIVLYGRNDHIAELDNRKAGAVGDRAHELRCEEQRRDLAQQFESEGSAPQGQSTEPPPHQGQPPPKEVVQGDSGDKTGAGKGRTDNAD